MSLYSTSLDVKVVGSGYYANLKLAPIVKCRMGRYADLPTLATLVDKQTYSIFGTDNVESTFEKSYVCFVAENSDADIVAAVFFNNYPNVPSVPPWDWVSWARSIYHLLDVNSRNTLFVHLAVYNARYARYFFEPLLREIFGKCFHARYVLLVVPPQRKFVDFLCADMSVVQPRGARAANPQRLVLYLRHDFVTPYKIRRAVVEDNDDLVPLIDTHSRRLRETYGSYYVAQIVSDQDSDRFAIVSEHEQAAVGVILFKEDFDPDPLNKCFHLECFYGLRKHSSLDDAWVTPQLAMPSGRIEEMLPLMFARCDSTESEQDSDTELDSSTLQSFPCPYGKESSSASSQKGSERGLPRGSPQNIDSHLQQLSFGSLAVKSSATTSALALVRGQRMLMMETVKGAIEGKFSCNLLHFTEAQLCRWQKTSQYHSPGCSISYSSTVSKLFKFRKYHGELNAFVLEIMAAWPEHEHCLPNLLRAGFELFPDRDYCVMCTPSDAPFFQLLVKTFVRVSPLPMSNFPHELYVVHRNSLSSRISLRRAKHRDRGAVRTLLDGMPTGDAILRTFVRYLDSKTDSVQSYVVLCDTEVVGVVNLTDVENLAYVLSRYQLSRMVNPSEHKPGCHGRIEHFALSPIFQRHTVFLLLELHRLSDYSLLLYFVYPEEKPAGPFRHEPLGCLLNELIPVVPAKVSEFSKPAGEDIGWVVPDIMQKVEKPYAVYMSTPMYCGVPRFQINMKIVVVGASEVGLSFLIQLLFNNNPKLHTIFNNVTLVSTHGMPKHRSSRWQDVMLPTTSEVTAGYYLSLLSLVTYVNVVKGVMSSIDRQNKTITVNSRLLPYDLLFLTCGTQFQPPERPRRDDDNVWECPENVFVINTAEDVNLAIGRLGEISNDDRLEGKYVVYGNCIEAYCCVEGLLEFELQPSDVIFVMPPYSERLGTTRVFDDQNVERAVRDRIASAGVALYKRHTFCDWTFDKFNLRIESIMFETATRTHEFAVRAAFMFQTKRISKQTFVAINGANLIFDGALVIGPDFQTNDPSVYAAGTMTKYSRRYYADHMTHAHFNQSEIGRQMAHVVLKKLLPVAMAAEADAPFEECTDLEGRTLVPRYGKPVMLFARVPRRLEYLHIRKPGVYTPMEVGSLNDDYGQVLTTGDINDLESQGYFFLHLNQYNTVETITAVTKNSVIERTNLTLLWGKHESLLNNLVIRYKLGHITDLFTFFARPWIHAVYHDEYEVLERDLTKLLMQPSVEPGMSIMEDIVQKIQENLMKMLTPLQHADVMDKFLKSTYHKEMERMVLDFLTDNSTYLPMYGSKSILTMIMAAFMESPLFTNL